MFQLARCAKDSAAAEQLVRIALQVLSCESIGSTGIGWDIFNLFSMDLLAFKVIKGCCLSDDRERYVYLENKGILLANVGQIVLAPWNREIFLKKAVRVTFLVAENT